MCRNTQQALYRLRHIIPAYDRVHVCPRDCLLFTGDGSGLAFCAVCGDPRYQVARPGKPQRIFNTLPVEVWMRRFFGNRRICRVATYLEECVDLDEGTVYGDIFTGSVFKELVVEPCRRYDIPLCDVAVIALCYDGVQITR